MAPLRRLHVPRAQLESASESRVALTADQTRYLFSVLRMTAGDGLEVFDGEGERFRARLALSAAGSAELEILKREEAASTSAIEIVLAQALIKADKLELVIQKATELGCARIVPFAAERSLVKLDEERGQARLARWRKIAEEAARQCDRADVPKIDAPVRFAELVSLAGRDELRGMVLDPLADMRLGEAAHGLGKVLLAVGPEGGFSPEETARAEEHGFARASLGSRILRTETAGLAAIAVLQHLAGELG